ncbi:MAG TPA: ABC transporter substrate-binding protein [Candidatus Thermoplasmatota archaeon]|nr:ABC transporter substrate-binding protein [Candidatus Thermoplasmatota archaeon]
MTSTRIVLLSAVTLLAVPVLAGCATNDGNGTGGGDDVDLTLKMGTLMPLTGALNSLGPSMQNGAKLAIQMVNDANVGIRIDATHEDDKTTDKTAITNTFNRLVSTNGVTATVGPCCSGITGAVLDLARQNEVLVATPSATSPDLTDNPNPFFWRTVPSDAMQGQVLASLVEKDNVQRVNMIVVNNAYGNGLANVFQQSFQGQVLVTAKYDENNPGDMSSQVTQVCATSALADAIVMVMYVDDGAAALKAMQNQGCLGKVKLYGSEGIWDAKLVERAGKGEDGKWLAQGVKGTAPGVPQGFVSLYKGAYNEDPRLYAAESFDSVMYVTLAALAAKSTDGKDISDNLVKIANAPGTKYRADQFADAARAVLNGDDIDYVGYAHDFDFDETKREPTSGVYDIWTINAEGQIEILESGVKPQ